jgi:hypothetical protein
VSRFRAMEPLLSASAPFNTRDDHALTSASIPIRRKERAVACPLHPFTFEAKGRVSPRICILCSCSTQGEGRHRLPFASVSIQSKKGGRPLHRVCSHSMQRGGGLSPFSLEARKGRASPTSSASVSFFLFPVPCAFQRKGEGRPLTSADYIRSSSTEGRA